MTDSMKFIPVPSEIFEELGFDENKVFQVECGDGKLVVSQPNKCILPNAAQAHCDDCCFCCPNCGACLAEQFFTAMENDEECGDDEDD